MSNPFTDFLRALNGGFTAARHTSGMKRRAIVLVAGVLAVLSIGTPSWAEGIDPGRNLKVSFKIKNHALESSGNFVIGAGKQVNYVVGGDEPSEIVTNRGKGVEFKKHGTIVNLIATVRPASGDVDLQVQVEKSGPLDGDRRLMNARPIETFQLQTTCTAKLGKPLVVVDEPDRRVELLVEDAPS